MGARSLWLAAKVAACAALGGAAMVVAAASEPPRAIEAAAAHLVGSQLENGLFRYEYDFVTGRYSQRDNLVRQAGAGFALAEYLSFHRDERVAAALRRALRAYAAMSRPFGGGRLLGTEPDLSDAKAGATALALVSALRLRAATGEDGFAAEIEDWAAALVALQLPDGGFAARPHVREQSPYSNGEIWLALAEFNDRFPADGKVARALSAADQAFLTRYERRADVGFFHWGLMATERRWASSGDARFARFALSQAKIYLDFLRPRVNPRSNSCYAVEGLLSAYAIARRGDGDRGLSERLRARIGAEMEKNLRLQLRAGQREIDLGSGRRLVAPDLAQFSGAFLNGFSRPAARIDATQHCLSAAVRYRDAFASLP